ncbi:Nn.00g038890.m01.CDS01 [Neocucurbitaria sp. VM-36]
MASATTLHFGFIKVESSPSPPPSATSLEPLEALLPRTETPAPIDPKDPEGFLKRCSGYKKTKLRCSVVIGKRAQQNTRPTYLPTCSAHRDQQSFAGWCQYKSADGGRCGRLFRWVPPYLELCSDHEDYPDTPCYLFNLPLELRHEIYRYLLPTRAIGSSTAALHDGLGDECVIPHSLHGSMNSRPRFTHQCSGSVQPESSTRRKHGSIFPLPLLNLLLVNRQIHDEAKDLLFSIAVFTIDVRKDGTFMCGRRLLEPRRADGSCHFVVDEAAEAKENFLKAFDWAAVKNYSVDILLENWSNPHPHRPTTWDEEVEIYDIRDYVSVVVSGILAKSRNLCKLQVRLCLADFKWPEEQILANTKLIVSPFERLRNVRQPQLTGVFFGRPCHNSMLTVQRPKRSAECELFTPPPICSVPPLPTYRPVLYPGLEAFDTYTVGWARCISSSNSATVTKKPPIRAMFTEFKDFYTRLAIHVPEISYLQGRHAFLHRARVAREQEDVECFRHLRNELIQHWYTYLEREESKKQAMNSRLSKMLDTDTYPSHEWDYEPPSPTIPRRTSSSSSAHSPVLLNADTMAKEGIPMTGNPRHMNVMVAGCTASTWRQHPRLRHLTPQQRLAFMQAQAQAQACAEARQRQQQKQQQQAMQVQMTMQAQPFSHFLHPPACQQVQKADLSRRRSGVSARQPSNQVLGFSPATTQYIANAHEEEGDKPPLDTFAAVLPGPLNSSLASPSPPYSEEGEDRDGDRDTYISPTLPSPALPPPAEALPPLSITSPGPSSSTKRRRVDSGFEDDVAYLDVSAYRVAAYGEAGGVNGGGGGGGGDVMDFETTTTTTTTTGVGAAAAVGYVGKGKGRMVDSGAVGAADGVGVCAERAWDEVYCGG